MPMSSARISMHRILPAIIRVNSIYASAGAPGFSIVGAAAVNAPIS